MHDLPALLRPSTNLQDQCFLASLFHTGGCEREAQRGLANLPGATEPEAAGAGFEQVCVIDQDAALTIPGVLALLGCVSLPDRQGQTFRQHFTVYREF